MGREDDGAGYWVYSFTPGCIYGQVKNPMGELDAAVAEFYLKTRCVPARWFMVVGLTAALRPHSLVSVHQDFPSAVQAYQKQDPGLAGVFRKAENNKLELVLG